MCVNIHVIIQVFVSFPVLNPGAGKLKLAFMPERNTFSVRRVGHGSTAPTRPHVQSSTTISGNKTMHSYRLPVNSYPEISPPQFTGLYHCGGLRKCSQDCGLLEAINLRECLQSHSIQLPLPAGRWNRAVKRQTYNYLRGIYLSLKAQTTHFFYCFMTQVTQNSVTSFQS